MITVNSARCGAGKTTQDIFPRISQGLAQGQYYIVAVPSQQLARNYRQHFGHDAEMIVSTAGLPSVRTRLEAALKTHTSLIIITHQAFVEFTWRRLDRQDYNLIIDEAFEPFRTLTYKIDDPEEIRDSFVLDDSQLAGNWFPVANNPCWREHTAYMESATYRDLTNDNWWLWQSRDDNRDLHQGLACEFGQELRFDRMFDHWHSIHIAAAKFEDTFMAYWLRRNQVKWLSTHEFEPHSNACVTWHSFRLRWSKNFRQQYPHVYEQYIDYVNNHSNEPILALRNNASNLKLKNETRLNHNCHGNNSYIDYQRISIESSLNLKPEHHRWIQDLLEMSNKEIKRARTTYTLYQTIMRSAIRRQETLIDPINIYSCDEEVTYQLWDYIDIKTSDVDVLEIPIRDLPTKPIPLTNAERARISRYKRKNPETTEGLTSREVLELADK